MKGFETKFPLSRLFQNFRGASGSGFGNSDPGRKGCFPTQIPLAEHSVND
jgi:hypothetical protein